MGDHIVVSNKVNEGTECLSEVKVTPVLRTGQVVGDVSDSLVFTTLFIYLTMPSVQGKRNDSEMSYKGNVVENGECVLCLYFHRTLNV